MVCYKTYKHMITDTHIVVYGYNEEYQVVLDNELNRMIYPVIYHRGSEEECLNWINQQKEEK